MKASQARIPDSLLERYLLEELPAERSREIAGLLEQDPELRKRLHALQASDREILSAYPTLAGLPRRAAAATPVAGAATPAAGAAKSPRRHWQGGIPRSPWLPSAGVAFASLVVMAYFLGPWSPERGASGEGTSDAVSGDPEVRFKGVEAGLAIYRKSRSGGELLPPQSWARPGDTLQVFYRSQRDLHGVIFSVDGNGSLTLHLPEAESVSAPLARGDLHPLPHAYMLDKAPRMERFYLVTSPSPFPVSSVLNGVRDRLRGGVYPPDSLPGLPEGFRLYTYTLKKPEAPARSRGGRR